MFQFDSSVQTPSDNTDCPHALSSLAPARSALIRVAITCACASGRAVGSRIRLGANSVTPSVCIHPLLHVKRIPNFVGILIPASLKVQNALACLPICLLIGPATRHPPHIPLQILAGPGSGKTKVLTSRIAYLIHVHELPPESICAVTFTNKAATEMRDRLKKLIGEENTSLVQMGTFHALCAKFLRRHAKAIGLQKNFTVCDKDESKKIITNLLKSHKSSFKSKDERPKEGAILDFVSKSKAKGLSPDDTLAEITERMPKAKTNPTNSSEGALPHEAELLFATIYEQYDRILRRNNSLDFEDLLIFGLKLFSEHEPSVSWCRHVLVDEFQDTNTTQYALMKALALERCVSVVGDPDQSIYGWRAADIKNLGKMGKDFPDVQQVMLEENYRSTGSILAASLAIVSQDKNRIQKSLRTAHPAGITPVLLQLPTEREEGAFTASEIKRLVAYTAGMLRYSDFVILLRYSALSRTIENALQSQGIPNRVLGGLKFFERQEVKDLLAYLQLVDNPRYDPALLRAVNVPARGIGEKTLSELALRAERLKLSILEVVERINDGKIPDIKPPVKRKVTNFVQTVRHLRERANKGETPAGLLRLLLELIEFEDYLKKSQPDFESRWENVQELITFASELTHGSNTPLRQFLQASMLSSDSSSKDENKEKVTISTCHAAKGLEWPVVIIPAVEKGTFPFYRSDDIEEERRLLYVACTRAQGLLYLTYTAKRKSAEESKPRDLSEFVSVITKDHAVTHGSHLEARQRLFAQKSPEFGAKDRMDLAGVLGRPCPREEDATRLVAEW
ncbi:UvrD-helicase-domain-containing protein [Pluteus cervinus]|uniref:UvrD-helicase-domain-containing protein n=1 Tax=Pluteus cervinus TaxID=181527 RepID=A0ACD3BBK8_9AGAR|nr:UvrD-helicase-domain-containing protein [Pluteus cervinus]